MRQIETRIEIEATPTRVWEILADFARYAEWNPFIRRAAGRARDGERIEAEMHLEGRSPMVFRPTIREAAEGRALRWLGSLGLRGLFDGEHYFQIEPSPAGATLVHGERFSGILVPLVFGRAMRTATLASFERMNRALKARAEGKA